MTDFSLHSIGYILFRRRRYDAFQEFIEDVTVRLGVGVLRLETRELKTVVGAAQEHTLDFDDAYQYAVAEKYNLTTVSYDTDFNHTPRGRTTPRVLLHQLEQKNQTNDSEDTHE